MAASERNDPPAGPFANLGKAYCNNLDTLAKSYEPLFMGASKWSLEVMNLMTRRTRAWLEIPTQASQCKTPQDLAKAQQQFWQTAVRDYTEGAQRLTAALGAIAPPALAGTWGSKPDAPARDYIAVSESKLPAEEPKRERRAA